MSIQFFKKYTNLNGTGTNIQLKKTSKNKFKKLFGNGNIEQNAITYKGLLKVPSSLARTVNGLTIVVNNDGSVTVRGTTRQTTTIDIQLEKPLVLNGTYTFSLKTVGSANNNAQQWLLRDANNAGIGLNPAVFSNQTSSATAENLNTTAVILRVYTIANKAFDCVVYPILEEGSTVTDWDSATTNTSPNPDYPQTIHNVTGNANVKIQNKNIYSSTLELGTINTTTGENESASNSIRSANYIEVKENTTYTISNNNNYQEIMYFYDKNKQFIGVTAGTNGDYSFTTPSNAKYIKNRTSGGSQQNDTTTKFQLELGSTATSYVEHQEQNLPLTLGNIELCKIGTSKDYFFKTANKWYLHKEIGKVVLDGTQNISVDASHNRCYMNYIDYGVTIRASTYGVCNMLKNSNTETTVGFNFGRSQFFIRINDTFRTVTEFNNFFNENNLILYGILDTPINTLVTDTTLENQLEAIRQAYSYAEETNISSESDGVGMIIDATAYKEVAKMMQYI